MESATMFRGMQQVLNKWRKKGDDTAIEQPGILKIETAPILLATERRQEIISEYKSIFNLSEKDFNRVFMVVINNFAEFVQELPETQTSYFAHHGGMLDISLERTLMTMHMCRAYLINDEQNLNSVSAYEMLWIYAVFTASLLLDVGIVATKHSIDLYDIEDKFTKKWIPYSGSMIGQGVGYRFEFLQENLDHLRYLVAPILAKQIMPVGEPFDDSEGDGGISESTLPTGFLSIASEPKILEAWLAMFTNDTRSTGTLLSIIHIIKAQMEAGAFIEGKTTNYHITPNMLTFLEKLKQKRFSHDPKNIKKQDYKAVTRSEVQPLIRTAGYEAVPSKVAFSSTPTAEAIAQFFNWVAQGIESGKFTVNQADSHIHVVSEKETILLPNLIEIYAKEIKGANLTSADVKALIQQFSNAPTEIIQPKIIEVNSAEMGKINQTLLIVNSLNVLPNTASVALLTQQVMSSMSNYPANVISAIQQQYGQVVIPNNIVNNSNSGQNLNKQPTVESSLNAPVNTSLNVPTYTPGTPKTRG